MMSTPDLAHVQTSPDEEDWPWSVLDTIVRRDDSRYERAFHYTTREALRQIVASGAIRPFNMPDIEEYYETPYLPMVWGTSNPVFEPVSRAADHIVSVYGNYLEALVEPHYEDLDAVRIEIPPDILHEWSSYMIDHGFNGFATAYLSMADMTAGSDANDWLVCGEPVGINQWLSVEVWDGEFWIPIGESSDEIDISTAQLLPPNITRRSSRSGAGNGILAFIRAQGGYSRVAFAISEYEYHAEYLIDSDFGTPYEILTETDVLDPVFRCVQALTTLSSQEADAVVSICGAKALGILRDNPDFARFIRGRIEAYVPGAFD